MSRLVLKLYIIGDTPRSMAAVDNLNRLVHDELPGSCELELIDVLEAPEAAEQKRILATPTLVKEHPPPQRRIIGDLSDTRAVLRSLRLSPQKESR